MNSVMPYDLLKALKVLDPAELNDLQVENLINLINLCCVPPDMMSIDDLKRDIRKLLCDPPLYKNCTVEYWTRVSQRYSDTLGRVLPYILCLPNSNASTERTFSMLKAVHSPVRNSLKLDTINGIISLKLNKFTDSCICEADEPLKKKCKSATYQYNQGLASQTL
jgi:hypothetical protein